MEIILWIKKSDSNNKKILFKIGINKKYFKKEFYAKYGYTKE